MAEEHNKDMAVEDSMRPITETPPILDKVQYLYVSYAQLAINTQDFRLAFGDRIPPDGSQVKPVIGVTMSHDLAKALLELLKSHIPKIDALMEKVRDQKIHPKSAIDGGKS